MPPVVPNMPRAGCWRFTLTWSYQHDEMFTRYLGDLLVGDGREDLGERRYVDVRRYGAAVHRPGQHPLEQPAVRRTDGFAGRVAQGRVVPGGADHAGEDLGAAALALVGPAALEQVLAKVTGVG